MLSQTTPGAFDAQLMVKKKKKVKENPLNCHGFHIVHDRKGQN